MILKIILTILLAAGSGQLYRMGGSGKFNTKARDVGCSLVMMLTMFIWGGWHWSLLLSGFAMFGALTTYWDFLNKWLPVQDKGKEYWWNWLIHGFFVSFAMIFWVIFYSHNWTWFWVRNVVVAVGVMLVSILTGKVEVEERGRGGIPVITLPALFI